MSDLLIPHDALVFVGDGTKALFLRNEGSATDVRLKPEQVFVDANPLTHDQGTERPGRGHARLGPRRSAVEQTDWHQIEEHQFVHVVSAALEKIVREHHAKALVVVAPPRVLGDLRRDLHDDVKACIVGEIGRDLTNQPMHEIERHLAG